MIAMDVPRIAASAQALSDALVVERVTVRWTHVIEQCDARGLSVS